MHIQSLSSALGASIAGVDLSHPVKADIRETIKQAFVEHIVLLFRNQNLDPASQIRFTEWFGKVEPHPLRTRRTVDGYEGVLILENQPGQPGARNDYWHSDISHAEKPPLGSVLHAKQVPPCKGDTLFCNMYRAWDTLSDGMRTSLAEMRAWHSGAATQRRNQENNDGKDIPSVPHPRLQPIARTHPDSGRKALYVNPHFVTHIEHMSEAESKPLISFLETHSTKPENIYRHRWQVGDVLIWDNRAAMHYAVRDYTPEDRRLMHRTTAAGEVPY